MGAEKISTHPKVDTTKILPDSKQEQDIQEAIEKTKNKKHIKSLTLQVQSLEERMKLVNDLRHENTGLVGGIGDFVGEKLGTHKTGKEIYVEQVSQIQKSCIELNQKILDTLEKTPPSSPEEKTQYEQLFNTLQKLSTSELKKVTWGTATLNTTGGKDIQGYSHIVRGATAIGEAAFDTTAFAMECIGHASAMLAASALDSGARNIIIEDLKNVFSQITVENMKKIIALLPGKIEEVSKLPSDQRIEACIYLVGSLLLGLGIAGKGIQVGKSLAKEGVELTRVGISRVSEANSKLLQWAKIGKQELAKSAKHLATGAAIATLGSAQVTVGATTVGASTLLNVAGETGSVTKGAVGAKAILTKSTTTGENLATKMARAEARSGVSPETVLKNSNLSSEARLQTSQNLLGRELTADQNKAILHVHENISKGVYNNEFRDLRAMLSEMDKVGFSRDESRKLMENGVLGSLDEQMEVFKKYRGENFSDLKLVTENIHFLSEIHQSIAGEEHTLKVLQRFLDNEGQIFTNPKSWESSNLPGGNPTWERGFITIGLGKGGDKLQEAMTLIPESLGFKTGNDRMSILLRHELGHEITESYIKKLSQVEMDRLLKLYNNTAVTPMAGWDFYKKGGIRIQLGEDFAEMMSIYMRSSKSFDELIEGLITVNKDQKEFYTEFSKHIKSAFSEYMKDGNPKGIGKIQTEPKSKSKKLNEGSIENKGGLPEGNDVLGKSAAEFSSPFAGRIDKFIIAKSNGTDLRKFQTEGFDLTKEGLDGWKIVQSQKGNVAAYTVSHPTHGTHTFRGKDAVQDFFFNNEALEITPISSRGTIEPIAKGAREIIPEKSIGEVINRNTFTSTERGVDGNHRITLGALGLPDITIVKYKQNGNTTALYMVEGLPQRNMNGYTIDQLKTYIQELQITRGIHYTVGESGNHAGMGGKIESTVLSIPKQQQLKNFLQGIKTGETRDLGIVGLPGWTIEKMPKGNAKMDNVFLLRREGEEPIIIKGKENLIKQIQSDARLRLESSDPKIGKANESNGKPHQKEPEKLGFTKGEEPKKSEIAPSSETTTTPRESIFALRPYFREERAKLLAMSPAERLEEGKRLEAVNRELVGRKSDFETRLSSLGNETSDDLRKQLEKDISEIGKKIQGNELDQRLLKKVDSLTRPLIENNVSPNHVVSSLQNPADRTKLAEWVDKMKDSNPAKLAILAAIIGIAYYLWPKGENEEVPPVVNPATPAGPQIEAACGNQVPGIGKSDLSLERKNQYGAVLKKNTRESISERWIQGNEWKSTINELKAIPAGKVNAEFLKLVSTVDSTPTIHNVQALQQWIGMQAKDDKTAQDGILGPITTGQIRTYLSSCKR